MEATKKKTLIVGIIIFGVFLMNFSFEWFVFPIGHWLTYLLSPVLEFCALAASLFVIFNNYRSVATTFKILVASLLLVVVKRLSGSFMSEISAIVYMMVKPLIAFGLIMLICLILTRKFPKITKPHWIPGAAILCANAIFVLIEYLKTIRSIWGFMGFSMTRQQLFDYELCFWCICFLGLIAIIKDLPNLPIPKIEKTEEPEPESPGEDYWKCMGCGEFVSNDKKRCDCGYRR